MSLRPCHRRPTSRRAVWLLGAALLVQAAMPMLASASAEIQGKALGEFCTVVGPSMMSVDADRQAGVAGPGQRAPTPNVASTLVDHQCGLTALATPPAKDTP